MRNQASLWVLAGSVGAAVLALLFFYKPEGQLFYPRCTFYQMTGLLCPGCGGLRSSHELLHGRVLEAARCNLLLVLGIPMVLAGALWSWRTKTPVPLNGRLMWIAFAVVVAFTVARNLPGAPAHWLAP